jgi:hypothetical protein
MDKKIVYQVGNNKKVIPSLLWNILNTVHPVKHKTVYSIVNSAPYFGLTGYHQSDEE